MAGSCHFNAIPVVSIALLLIYNGIAQESNYKYKFSDSGYLTR